ncbi:MAG: nucleoside deaminase [Bacteroidota bacterium]|nr:nucleoside deaminase [Bacteroidota bacterium]
MEILDLKESMMRKAIIEAEKAFEQEEVPIGCIIIHNNKIIGKGYNQTELMQDVTAHAEILAITAASLNLNSKYLNDCDMYVTVEPCVMCLGAIKHSRISKLFIGTLEPKTGYSRFINMADFHPEMIVESGTLQAECKHLMQSFFQEKRNKS